MGRSQRDKGARGEVEIVNLLRAYGWDACTRNFSSGAQGHGDIAFGPQGIHLEIKRQERTTVWDWIRQAREDADHLDIPVVAFRRNNEAWHAVLPLEELLPLLVLRERG